MGHEKILFILVMVLVNLPADSAFAGTSAQSFTYQGRVFNSKRGVPLEDIVDFTYTIYNPNKNCILYEEVQPGVDLTTTGGAFSNQVGSDVGGLKRTANDPGLAMSLIFQNTRVVRLPGTPNCPQGYTPASGDAKYLRVTVTPRSTGVANVLSPDQLINSVPQASTSDNVQGLSPTDLIQAAAGVSGQGNVSLANLMTLTGGTDASTLHNHDSIYVRSGSGGTPTNLGGSAYTSGSLGIGTSSPTGNLGFSGSAGSQTIEVNRNGVVNSVGSDLNIVAGGATLSGTNQGGGNLVLSGGMSTGSSGSQILFQTSSSGGAGTADNAGSTKMVLNSSGKLGIGTATPGAQLEVDAGTASTIGTIIKGFVAQVSDFLQIRDSTNATLAKIDATGKIFGTGIDAGSQVITNVGTPVAGTDAANKSYVAAQIAGAAGVGSFNTRTGAVTLSSADVTTALTYTPLKNSSDAMTGTLGIGAAVGVNTQFQSTSTSATQITGVFKEAATQTADILEFQNSAGTVLSKVDSAGVLTLAANPTSGLQAATKSYVDTATNNMVVSAAGTTNYIPQYSSGVALVNSPLYVNGSNVGIGTTTAGSTLDVNGSTTFRGTVNILQPYAYGFANGQLIRDNGGGGLSIAVPNYSLNLLSGADPTGAITFATNGNTERMRVTNAGNVGVGTTAPTTGWSKTIQVYDSSNADLSVKTSANEWHMTSDATGGLFFTENPSYTRRLFLQTGGNVGIGTVTPTSVLHLKAGTIAANTAPLKLTLGPVLTAPEAGAIEYDGTNLFYTDGSATRRALASTSSIASNYLPLLGGTMTGAIVHSNGTVGAPSLSFANDATTGFYSTGAGNITASTAGAARVTINSSGNMGIGTTSPGAQLSVFNSGGGPIATIDTSSGGGGYLSILQGGTARGYLGTGNSLTIGASVSDVSLRTQGGNLLFSNSGGNESMRLTNTGNLGIGTASPTAALQINPATTSTNGLIISGAVTNPTAPLFQVLRSDGNQIASLVGVADSGIFTVGYTPNTSTNVSIGAASGSSQISMKQSGVNTIQLNANAAYGPSYINVANNFGIGTATPAYKLDVNGSLNATTINLNGSAITSSQWTTTGSDIYYNTGKVGIGTTSPSQQLHVAGVGQTIANITDAGLTGATINLQDNNIANPAGAGGTVLFSSAATSGVYAQAAIKSYLNNGGGRGVGDLQFLTRNATTDTNLTERMRITSSGNLGIGTANPVSILDIEVASPTLNLIGTSGNIAFRMADSPNSASRKEFTIINDTTNNRVDIQAIQQGVAARNITLNAGGGNIGIGTITPIYKFHTNLATGLNLGFRQNGTSAEMLSFNETGPVIAAMNLEGSVISLNSRTGGNVGIGTSTPTALLDIVGASAMAQFRVTSFSGQGPFPVVFKDGGSTNQISMPAAMSSITHTGGTDFALDNSTAGYSLNFNNNGAERMRINSLGNLGLGTSSPSYRLHVLGAGGATVAYFSDGTASCSITPATAGNISCSSDERLKKDIEAFSSEEALEKILKLETVTYAWKHISNGRHTGYIAQKVEEIAPEFVTTGSDGLKQVSYGGFIPWITSAIQELNKKGIELLKSAQENSAEIDRLKSENEQLKTRLLKIEKSLSNQK